MANTRSTNDNEAITKLPILLIAGEGVKGDGWIAAPELVQVLSGKGMVLKRQPVRVVPERALAQFASPKTRGAFESAFGHIPETSAKQLLSLLAIAHAAEKKDLKQVAILVERAETSAGTAVPSWAVASAVHSPWDRVGAALNTGLHKSMLVLWQKETQLVPGLLCWDTAQALFAHALFVITGKMGLGVCRRCGNPFFASRSRQSFCSYRCRAAQAMKRYRKKLKSKAQRHMRARKNRSPKRRRAA